MRALCAVLFGLLAALPARSADLTVFAAASMTDVVQDLAEAYTRQSGETVALSFAASSTLARQIERGAPADIFISANHQWIDHLATTGSIDPKTRQTIAGNRLVLITGGDGIDEELSALPVLADKDRIAVGDPGHVPVGRYAQQALVHSGHWQVWRARLIPSANTRAAVSFVERGAARYGIAYGSDALAFPRVRKIFAFPPSSHDPIRYEAVLTVRSRVSKLAGAFLTFLTGPDAALALERFGFAPHSVK